MPVLVDGTRLDDLAKLYGLVARVNKLGDLRAVFAAHVKVSGALIVQDPQKDKEMVKELMVFKARMDSIVNGPFKTDSSFSHCMQEYETRYPLSQSLQKTAAPRVALQAAVGRCVGVSPATC